MTSVTFKPILKVAVIGLSMASLSACNMISRLSQVGDGPQITEIENPTHRPNYRPVSMPMPAPKMAQNNPNSLWRAGARAFFKDNRAKEVGDILTVSIEMTDSATMNNKTERTRDDSEDGNLTNLLGLEGEYTKFLPQAVTAASTMSMDTDHVTKGDGTIDRKETVNLSVAAVITQILPNGNLVISGRQEMRINYEMRELMITGVIRREDIDSSNAITHEKIAEMRVSYGGRGNLTDLQQPRYGWQLMDILMPF